MVFIQVVILRDFGQVTGQTEMPEYDMIAPPSDGEPVKVSFRKTYMLEPGMAVGYPAGGARVPDLKRKGLDEVSEFFE